MSRRTRASPEGARVVSAPHACHHTPCWLTNNHALHAPAPGRTSLARIQGTGMATRRSSFVLLSPLVFSLSGVSAREREITQYNKTFKYAVLYFHTRTL